MKKTKGREITTHFKCRRCGATDKRVDFVREWHWLHFIDDSTTYHECLDQEEEREKRIIAVADITYFEVGETEEREIENED